MCHLSQHKQTNNTLDSHTSPTSYARCATRINLDFYWVFRHRRNYGYDSPVIFSVPTGLQLKTKVTTIWGCHLNQENEKPTKKTNTLMSAKKSHGVGLNWKPLGKALDPSPCRQHEKFPLPRKVRRTPSGVYTQPLEMFRARSAGLSGASDSQRPNRVRKKPRDSGGESRG